MGVTGQVHRAGKLDQGDVIVEIRVLVERMNVDLLDLYHGFVRSVVSKRKLQFEVEIFSLPT